MQIPANTRLKKGVETGVLSEYHEYINTKLKKNIKRKILANTKLNKKCVFLFLFLFLPVFSILVFCHFFFLPFLFSFFFLCFFCINIVFSFFYNMVDRRQFQPASVECFPEHM